MKRFFLTITCIVSVLMALIPAQPVQARGILIHAKPVLVLSDPGYWNRVLSDITKRMSRVSTIQKMDSLYYGKAQITSEILVHGKPVAVSREYGWHITHPRKVASANAISHGVLIYSFFPNYYAYAWPIDADEQRNASVDNLLKDVIIPQPGWRGKTALLQDGQGEIIRYRLYDFRTIMLKELASLANLAPCFNETKDFAFKLLSMDSTCCTIAFEPAARLKGRDKSCTGTITFDAVTQRLHRIHISYMPIYYGYIAGGQYVRLLANRYGIPKQGTHPCVEGDFWFDENGLVTSACCSASLVQASTKTTIIPTTTSNDFVIQSWWRLTDVQAISADQLEALSSTQKKQQSIVDLLDNPQSDEAQSASLPIFKRYFEQFDAAHYDREVFARLPLLDPDFAECEAWLGRENDIESQYQSATLGGPALKPFIGVRNGRLDTIPTKNFYLNDIFDELVLRQSVGARSRKKALQLQSYIDQLREYLSGQEL